MVQKGFGRRVFQSWMLNCGIIQVTSLLLRFQVFLKAFLTIGSRETAGPPAVFVTFIPLLCLFKCFDMPSCWQALMNGTGGHAGSQRSF